MSERVQNISQNVARIDLRINSLDYQANKNKSRKKDK